MEDGAEHTLGLLMELRNLCIRIAEHHDRYAADLNRVLQAVHNPNLHGLDENLSCRVVQLGEGYYSDTVRVVAATSNLYLGTAVLVAAVKQNPRTRWLLKYPGGVAGRYDPPGTVINDK